jgi:hypothetical protein
VCYHHRIYARAPDAGTRLRKSASVSISNLARLRRVGSPAASSRSRPEPAAERSTPPAAGPRGAVGRESRHRPCRFSAGLRQSPYTAAVGHPRPADHPQGSRHARTTEVSRLHSAPSLTVQAPGLQQYDAAKACPRFRSSQCRFSRSNTHDLRKPGSAQPGLLGRPSEEPGDAPLPGVWPPALPGLATGAPYSRWGELASPFPGGARRLCRGWHPFLPAGRDE